MSSQNDVPTMEGVLTDSSFKYDGLWVIYTHRKNYRIFKPLLDPEAYSLKVAVRNGVQELDVHPLARGLPRKQFAAESLPYSKEREKLTLWCMADPNGVFHCKNGKLAELIWEHVKNDPAPKPELDMHNPPFPGKDAPVVPTKTFTETIASTIDPDGPPVAPASDSPDKPWADKKD